MAPLETGAPNHRPLLRIQQPWRRCRHLPSRQLVSPPLPKTSPAHHSLLRILPLLQLAPIPSVIPIEKKLSSMQRCHCCPSSACSVCSDVIAALPPHGHAVRFLPMAKNFSLGNLNENKFSSYCSHLLSFFSTTLWRTFSQGIESISNTVV